METWREKGEVTMAETRKERGENTVEGGRSERWMHVLLTSGGHSSYKDEWVTTCPKCKYEWATRPKYDAPSLINGHPSRTVTCPKCKELSMLSSHSNKPLNYCLVCNCCCLLLVFFDDFHGKKKKGKKEENVWASQRWVLPLASPYAPTTCS